MSIEKKILDFDKNELFVSSRICEFLLDNALKVNLSENLINWCSGFVEKHDLYKQNSKEYSIGVLIELIDICRKANCSADQFYAIGNQNHELHVLVSSIFSLKNESPIDWKTELNLLKLSIFGIDQFFTIQIEIHDILPIEHKNIFNPLIQIINGFMVRINSYFFNSMAEVSINKNGLLFKYKATEVSNFDYVRFISDEQIFYSRVKSFLEESHEESIVDQISFFLFKDIGFSLEEIALKLNLSVRSIQRRLKTDGFSFRNIKEKVRKELSVKYLADSSLSMHDVCLLLAYSERGAFEKAFKKWYGMNPVAYKKGLT